MLSMNTTLFILVVLIIGSGQEPQVVAKDLTEQQCIAQRDAMFEKAVANNENVIIACKKQ